MVIATENDGMVETVQSTIRGISLSLRSLASITTELPSLQLYSQEYFYDKVTHRDYLVNVQDQEI